MPSDTLIHTPINNALEAQPGNLPAEPLLTVEQAAAILAVNPRTVRRAIADGELPVRRIRGCIRIEASALQAFIKSS